MGNPSDAFMPAGVPPAGPGPPPAKWTIEDAIRLSAWEEQRAELLAELAALREAADVLRLTYRCGWSSGMGQPAFTIMLRGDEVERFRRAVLGLEVAAGTVPGS